MIYEGKDFVGEMKRIQMEVKELKDHIDNAVIAAEQNAAKQNRESTNSSSTGCEKSFNIKCCCRCKG